MSESGAIKTKRIDVHSHVVPDEMLHAIESNPHRYGMCIDRDASKLVRAAGGALPLSVQQRRFLRSRTLAESGVPGFNEGAFHGVMAPRSSPAPLGNFLRAYAPTSTNGRR